MLKKTNKAVKKYNISESEGTKDEEETGANPEC